MTDAVVVNKPTTHNSRRSDVRMRVESGADDIASGRRIFQPQLLEITYTRDDDEPLQVSWVGIAGPRRLKDKRLSDNTWLRTGQSFRDASTHEEFRKQLTAQRTDPWEHADRLPEWVAELVEKYWPTDL